MKIRVNICIGPLLHADAVAFGKTKEMGFSELVAALLRDAIDGRVAVQVVTKARSLRAFVAGRERREAVAKVVPSKPMSVVAGPPEAPFGMRLLAGERPSKNRPCPCGSGEKYKRCCEKHFPLVHTPKSAEMSRNEPGSLAAS